MSNEFRDWLSEEIKQRAWSQRELARRSDISYPLISQVLAGDVPPSADFCIKAAHALGEPPEKVLRLAGILPPASDDDPLLTELHDLVNSLLPSQRERAADFLRWLRQSAR